MQDDDTGALAPSASGRIRGQLLSPPVITIERSPFCGFIAIARDSRGNRLSVYGRTEAEAIARAELLWGGL